MVAPELSTSLSAYSHTNSISKTAASNKKCIKPFYFGKIPSVFLSLSNRCTSNSSADAPTKDPYEFPLQENLATDSNEQLMLSYNHHSQYFFLPFPFPIKLAYRVDTVLILRTNLSIKMYILHIPPCYLVPNPDFIVQ